MRNIVLVGAGGTGMSGVAGILHDLGYTNIIAIDSVESQLTQRLRDKGIKTIIGHGKYKVLRGDIIIYSEATRESVEVLEARAVMKAKKMPMIILNYFEFLGEVSKNFISVGITGTNGKSSTTALAIATAKKVLPDFGLGILGALVPDLDNNSYYINPKVKTKIKTIFDFMLNQKRSHELQHDAYKLIKKYYFLVESCEYKRHFLHLDLDYAIITNMELDHTDYYKDFADYTSAFQQFADKVKNTIFIPKGFHNLSNGKWKMENGKFKEVNIQKISFKKVRGKHNDINGSLVLALLKKIGNFQSFIINPPLLNFKGLRRRMELLGKNKNGANIYSDYGHMASSITVGYKGLKEKFPKQKLICIFQPHQIHRIVTGRNDFIASMKGYDEVVIYDIYAARENLLELVKEVPELKGIKTLKELGNKFASACGGTYIDTFETITKKINEAKKGEIVVIYSAGDIDFLVRKNSSVISNEREKSTKHK
ncbi:MAG: Mur ligase family protein [candidate division SR1 bacterium]|nr:Mur ligase family protein [candidate division SR1 bacterium]